MNNLQVFKNTEFGELKVLVIDGKEYFLQQIVQGCWDTVTHTRQ